MHPCISSLTEENKFPMRPLRTAFVAAALLVGMTIISTTARAENTFTLRCKLHSEQTVWNNDGSDRRITTSTIIRTLTIDLDHKRYYIIGDDWSARDIPKVTATEIILDDVKFGADASRFAKINRATGLYTADVQSGRWLLYEVGPCDNVQTELPPAKF